MQKKMTNKVLEPIHLMYSNWLNSIYMQFSLWYASAKLNDLLIRLSSASAVSRNQRISLSYPFACSCSIKVCCSRWNYSNAVIVAASVNSSAEVCTRLVYRCCLERLAWKAMFVLLYQRLPVVVVLLRFLHSALSSLKIQHYSVCLHHCRLYS